MNLKKTFFVIVFFSLAGSVSGASIESISRYDSGKIELRRNFHINFTRTDKEGINLYKRQLMEFATSPVQVPLKWYFTRLYR